MAEAVVPLAIIITLAVSTAAQPGLAEQLVLDLAVLLEIDLAFVDVDFAGQMGRHPVFEAFFPASQFEHPSVSEPPMIGRAAGGSITELDFLHIWILPFGRPL
jgi:hypothetical protein